MNGQPLRYLSLFSGIGGFDLGFDRAGMVCAGQVEFDEKARAVLAKHWPDVPRLNDVREVNGDEFGSIDLICGGFPCQDVSVAGRRAGLAGERSGLWHEFHRLIEAILPSWIVIENVPGLLSSNGGEDIQIIIDSLTQIGYAVDIDIKDAQEFGVAQRRRRVFLTCVRLDDLLQKRTNLSRQVSADLLAQTLLGIWGAIPPASSHVPLRSVYEKPIERCAASLNRMTSLLRITRERLASKKYHDNLTVLLDQFGGEENGWACGSTERNERQDPQLLDRDTYEFLSKPKDGANGVSSISTLLSSAWGDVCELGSKSITSTSTPEITERRIFTFAKAALHTIALMLHSLDWSVNCWSVAQSVSTLLQENMNYARRASRHLFIESGLRNDWRDYLSAASRIETELERRIGAIRAAEILFERDGGSGGVAPCRGQGQDVAATVAAGAGSRRNGGSDPTPGHFVTHALTAEGHDASEDGTGRGVPILAAPLVARQAKVGFTDPVSDNIIPVAATLNSGGNNGGFRTEPGEHLVVAFSAGNSSDSYGIGLTENCTPPLRAGNSGTNMTPTVAGGFGVRRLTPVECERLQGFPDNWTDGQSDSARYRQLGNAVAVPVAEWLGRRIAEAQQQEKPQ
jgi:DNA-cytosine methyltransferase